MNVHHIGYAVRNIEKSQCEFENMGYHVSSEVVDDLARQIKILFMKNGNYVVELVQPLSAESPVSGILKRSGEGPYHICYEVDDIETELLKLTKNKFKIFQDIAVAPAIDNRKVAFLYNINIGIIELVEK